MTNKLWQTDHVDTPYTLNNSSGQHVMLTQKHLLHCPRITQPTWMFKSFSEQNHHAYISHQAFTDCHFVMAQGCITMNVNTVHSLKLPQTFKRTMPLKVKNINWWCSIRGFISRLHPLETIKLKSRQLAAPLLADFMLAKANYPVFLRWSLVLSK